MNAATSNITSKKPFKGSGGRSVKVVKRNVTLTIKCTLEEEALIKAKAKHGSITVRNKLNQGCW